MHTESLLRFLHLFSFFHPEQEFQFKLSKESETLQLDWKGDKEAQPRCKSAANDMPEHLLAMYNIYIICKISEHKHWEKKKLKVDL